MQNAHDKYFLEKRELSKFGYIHLKNVLTLSEIRTTLQAVDDLIILHLKHNPKLQDTNSKFGKGAFRIYQAIEQFDGMDFLLDYPKVFDLLVSLIGEYIQVMGSEVFIRNTNTNYAEKFHTDAGPSIQKYFYSDDMPLLQLKVQFFLTDTISENSGNFICIPGSHRIRVLKHEPGCFIEECNKYLNNGEKVPHAHQFIAKAGDVIIFPWCLWHGATHNTSDITRRSVCLRYGPLWCRPYDYSTISNKKMQKLTPRQRRLLGDLSQDRETEFDPSDYYKIPNQAKIIRTL